MVETTRIEDFDVEGPRLSTFSHMPEVRTTVLYSFKNVDVTSWRHIHDILMPTCMLPTDFMADLRSAIAVSEIIFV